jgi:hypothetical protein
MSGEAVAEIVDRWMNEPGFKEQLIEDTEGTLQRNGLVLTEDDRAALENITDGLGDEELESRLSKIGVWLPN